MLDRLGKVLEVGSKVLVLQVPVVGQHEFVEATVTRLTSKSVYVEYLHKDRWGSNRLRAFKRYPDQVILIQGN